MKKPETKDRWSKVNFLRFFKLEKFETKLIFLLSIIIFFLINLVISAVSLRVDLSSGRAYSLSSSTKKILKKVDDLVIVEFFVSSDLPSRLLPLKTDVEDFLKEYQKANKKIVLKFLDPKKDEKAATKARESGLPELQFSQLERDKYAVSNVYFGLVIGYGPKKEIIPQITDLENLEYNVTAAIYKLTKKELEKIAVLGKEESFTPQEDDLASLKNLLRQQFQVEFIKVGTSSGQTKIGTDYKAILVFDDGKKQYSKDEINIFQDYLSNQGKAIFFVDGVWIDDNLLVSNSNHNLNSLFSTWGIKVEPDLVLSTSAELVNFGNQMVQFLTTYPYWLRANNFNHKYGIFSNVNQLVFPWVSSITLTQSKDYQSEFLVKTTKTSWRIENPNSQNLNPQTIPEPNRNDLKEFVVTAWSKAKTGGQIVVVPSSRFVLERYLGRGSANLEFILNLLNEVATGGALSGIRQRQVGFYPLPPLAETQKEILRWVNIILLPSLFGFFGFWRLIRRR